MCRVFLFCFIFCLPRIYQVYLPRTSISLLYCRKGVRPLRVGCHWELTLCIGPGAPETPSPRCLDLYWTHGKTQKPQACIRVDMHYVLTAISWHLCSPPPLAPLLWPVWAPHAEVPPENRPFYPSPLTLFTITFSGAPTSLVEGIIAVEVRKV